ncbi:MAG TPA: rhomboid family intramembrane serine protease [Candidatus Limnocylindria bacterium]|nr:rhomboid family intramembrane serine protease [Candidatus Limnocylindria bacterium]
MIPLSDSNPTARAPIVNRALLLVNLVVWLYTFSLSRDPAALEAFYTRYAFDWSRTVAQLSSGTVGLDSVETLSTLVTHMFLHGGWLHVIGNLLYLWIFGDNVEERFGSVRYLAFYLLCGIIAAVGQGIIQPAPMVGASGAVAGVLGAYLFLFPGSRVRTLIFLGLFITIVQLPAIVVIGLWIVVQVLSGLAELRMSEVGPASNVAFFAHVVGFVAGILLLAVLRPSRRARVR